MFKSNAVRSCVELHEIELRRFHDTWLTFRASGTPLPATDDPSYQSSEDLVGHVLRSSRNYLTWICDCVKRPVTYKSRWGEDYDIEQMLEHAVVHPMRHRIQLERLASGGASPARSRRSPPG